MLSVWLAGAGTASCTLPVHPAPDTGVEPWVSVRPSLEVAVVDEAGAPVSGAWVVVEPGGRDATTDVSGRARLARLGDGAWSVSVTAAGFVPATATVEIGDEDAVLTVPLSVPPAPIATIGGLVSDPTGAPVAGAEISVEGVAATTDAGGVWTLTLPEAGSHTLHVRPPPGSNLVEIDAGPVTVEAGKTARTAWTLPAGPPAGSHFVGSTPCASCHPTQGAAWAGSAHARATRSQNEAVTDLPELGAAFAAGQIVPLDPVVPGATASLGTSGDGAWEVTIADAGGADTGPLRVLEVYGGNSAGAALSLDRAGEEVLAPITFALAGRGASSRQAPAGLVPSYTAGWFDAAGALRSAPGPEASYALQCAGCHATGVALAEDGDGYALIGSVDAFASERRVGCEACHERGGAHTQAFDARLTTVLDPGLLPVSARVEVCARCHERTTPDAHPFDDTPGWPTDGSGEAIGPLDPVSAFADPAPEHWSAVPASRVGWDQVGDFRTSPHAVGDYAGACEDCHDPHGSAHPAGLRADPSDNALCTACHFGMFPDPDAEAVHARHNTFAPGPWSPGACTSCHLPRTGITVRADAVSGAGERHSHVLTFFQPSLSLAEFDAAGVDVLPLGAVPIPACLDCHLQADAAAEDEGGHCACAVGDPRVRGTFEGMQDVYDIVWGAP